MSGVLGVVPIGLHWPTLDPFLFCAHHLDEYPAGNANLGVDASKLLGRRIGSDFELKDGWRMYHGREVPGFPKHPHRGFETITLARRGFIDHSDSLGAAARFGEGDVQWMTAGRGVVHSEMFPLINRDKGNPAELFQVWLNLPAQARCPIPTSPCTGGSSCSVEWRRMRTVVPPRSWSWLGTTKASRVSSLRQIHGLRTRRLGFRSGRLRWKRVLVGNCRQRVRDSTECCTFTPVRLWKLEGKSISPNHAIQLRSDQAHRLQASSGKACSLLLLEGRPIGEPVAQHGPFVMNTRAELQQAFRDYQRDEFGGWSWKRDDPVHGENGERFAIHPDGRRETPPS